MKNLLLILTLIILSSCSEITGEEIARLPINAISTEDNLVVKEVALDLKSGDEIGIWSDMDMAYDGDVELRFRIGVLKNGEDYTTMEIDPTVKNITLGEFKSSINGQTKWSYTGKNKGLKIDEDATYIFKGIFVSSENPSLVITKAEVVLKK
ncbi:MAG: hypothetical protein ACI8XB_003029 [Patiriisocius sp.]